VFDDVDIDNYNINIKCKKVLITGDDVLME
jgi:hypothetical protein